MTYSAGHRNRPPTLWDRFLHRLADLYDWLRPIREQQPWDETDDHGNHIGDMFRNGSHGLESAGSLRDQEPWRVEAPAIQTAKVGGYHLPLSGEPAPVNPWASCAFTPGVPRPADGGSSVTHRSDPLDNRNGPGYPSVWDYQPAPRPGFWAPRPGDTLTDSRPRVCAGRIATAGAW